jgi:putative hemolysin
MSYSVVPDIIMLTLLPLLLVCSGFFSGCETALFSLSANQRLQFERANTLVGGIIVQLLAETRMLLITLLLGNMVVNVLYFVLCTMLMIRLRELHGGSTWVLGVIAPAPVLLLVLCGEVLPKQVALRLSEGWARLLGVPLYIVHRGLGPLRVFLDALVITPLARLIEPPSKPPELSAQELGALLELSEKRGVINAEEEELLQEVLDLSHMKVTELMTPRVDLIGFDLNDGAPALIELLKQCRHSHIPVYQNDIDHLEGIVYARQVLLRQPDTIEELRKMIRQVHFVPEVQRADQLLVHLRKTGNTLVIVVDEYGGTVGMVTLEDVVEHVVGDIALEHEPAAEPPVQTVDDRTWRVRASLSVRDWLDQFHPIGAPRLRPVSTLGGLIMATLGRLPREGDHLNVGNVSMRVESMHGRRIDWVRLQLNGSDDNTPNGLPKHPGHA